jgi:hypothetical protein
MLIELNHILNEAHNRLWAACVFTSIYWPGSIAISYYYDVVKGLNKTKI